MNRFFLLLLLLATLLPVANARGRSATTIRKSASATKAKPKSTKCASCSRNAKGRIARSAVAKRSFQKTHPCPSTRKATGACPGYVIDHMVPLKRGGADVPGNMQWQTTAAAKAKDKIE